MKVQTATNCRVENDPLAALKECVQGQVITPTDPGYAEARLGWNRSVDQYPAVIVIAAGPGDVGEAVQYARRQGMGIAVQSTGHGLAMAADHAVLIVTSHLKELHVNPAERTAWVGAGLKWGEVLARTQEYGLAPLLGSSPGVGVVGYTLGGGLGWLGRKYGLAADSVLSFELVSVDGLAYRASAGENPDLYWGLRGGGGSFGIVTGMEIRLYPVETVYGGNLYYPGALAREVMQRYREWIRSAPEALTSSVALMNYPPVPQAPEILRGKSFAIVRGCYAGPVEEGAALLQSWRDWKAPLIDDFKAMPFSDAAKISNDPVNPMPSKATGAWMRELSDAAIDTLVRYTIPRDGPPAITFSEVRHAGGAIARVAPGESAFSRRDAELLLSCVGMAPTPEAYARLGRLTDQMKAELAPALTGGAYMNFFSGMEARRRTQEGYSAEAFRRLRALKAKMDPQNLLRFGFDIPPE